MRKEKRERGITLIALVITIIVLLILAGVSIATLTGEGGILKKTKEAKEWSTIEEEKEQIKLAYSTVVASKIEKQEKIEIEANELKIELNLLGMEVITEEKEDNKIKIIFLKSKNNYIIDGRNGQIIEEGDIPDLSLHPTEETMPYLIDESSEVLSNDYEEGIVVKDKNENEWVWIEVPKTIMIYKKAGLNIINFTEEEYLKIEEDLQIYAGIYRESNNKDEFSSMGKQGFNSKEEYDNHKKGMLKSIYEKGGFYIGRYEAGSTIPRYTENAELTKVVIQQDVYPYNFITCAQAQERANTLATEGRTSSLMFGIQWDLVLKYIEEKGKKLGETKEERQNKLMYQEGVKTSIDWGNYGKSEFTITRGEYTIAPSTTNSWTKVKTENTLSYKKSNGNVLFTTGATKRNSVLNIYDLAGNVWEWTLEQEDPFVKTRGGTYYNDDSSACKRGKFSGTELLDGVGFRPTLW